MRTHLVVYGADWAEVGGVYSVILLKWAGGICSSGVCGGCSPVVGGDGGDPSVSEDEGRALGPPQLPSVQLELLERHALLWTGLRRRGPRTAKTESWKD